MYEELANDFIDKVFDDALRYCAHRNGGTVEVKDVTRALKNISIVPPGEWQSLKLNKNHILHQSNYKNSSILQSTDTHRKRLQMINRVKISLDNKKFNKK